MKASSETAGKRGTDLWHFEEAALPHLDAAYNLARWLTCNDGDAQDVVREAYGRAFRFFDGLQGRNARHWLLKIVRTTFYKWLSCNRALQPTEEFDESLLASDGNAPSPEAAVIETEIGPMLRKALEKLPPNLREMLILRELEGLSYREIAEVTGTSPGTVLSELVKARDGLRQLCRARTGDSV